MHEDSRPFVLMLDCFYLATPCTCVLVRLWAYVLACHGGKFNLANFCNCSCYSCLTSSSCVMCFDATALSAEIDKGIWQTSLTRPMSATTSYSQTSQLEGMRAFETRLKSNLWSQPFCAGSCSPAQEPACKGCQERQPTIQDFCMSASFPQGIYFVVFS
jgi:hypothetical protein